MDALFLVLALIWLLATPVALIVAILALRRVKHLEAAQHGRVPAPAVAPTPPRDAPAPPPGRARPVPRRAASAPPSRDLESWLGGQWATWIGVLALFFGTAFFLGIDLGDHALAGAPQVGIGALVAIGFVIGGRRWSRLPSMRFLGLGLLGGGIALGYLDVYAAHDFHALVPLVVAFPLMLGIAAAGAVAALGQRSLALAAMTLTGALLTPLLLPDDGGRSFAVLPYLIAVNAGSVLVGHRRGWAGLSLASLLGSAVLVMQWLGSEMIMHLFSPPAGSVRATALLTVGASWAIFAAAPLLRAPTSRVWDVVRGLVTALSGLLYAGFVVAMLAGSFEQWRAPALVLLAVVHVVIAHRLRRLRDADPAASVTLHTGVAIAAIAAWVQLELAWVTFVWTTLAAVLLAHGVHRDQASYRIAGLGVVLLAFVRSAFVDAFAFTSTSDSTFLWNGPFLSSLALVALLGWTGWAYRTRHLTVTRPERNLATPLLLAAIALFGWRATLDVGTVWTERGRLLGADTAPLMLGTLTALWTLLGVATWNLGAHLKERAMRVGGTMLLVLAALKIVFVDAWTPRADALGMNPFVSLPFVAGLVLCLGLGHVIFRRVKNETDARYGASLALTLVLLLWVVSTEILHGIDAGRTMLLTLTLTWATYGGALIGTGFWKRLHVLRWTGICVLALTTVKVFVLDLQVLERGERIVALVGLGVLVLLISSVYQKRSVSDGDRVA